jgi:elongation factor G
MVFLQVIPIDAIKVELVDGSFHPVDSDQLSFELAAKMAFRSALFQIVDRYFLSQ